ncbi:hypothetical protein TNIN_360611 [Trichonephila inaurata madagascariensis]|uniref:Uncharacterized protein n=1 Tax=Trichonephila inaurata madagascariensis TaxID=2747483 RepID=A0A8X6WND4_9ARAC|nr:hypothetical protein TNIN_360611 [Trichonephila inaurata madagascariensis]
MERTQSKSLCMVSWQALERLIRLEVTFNSNAYFLLIDNKLNEHMTLMRCSDEGWNITPYSLLPKLSTSFSWNMWVTSTYYYVHLIS